jgi:hypothetical protein
MPKTSYGFHILGVIRAVTAMRYIMPAIIAQPPTIRRPRFSLLSSRFCFLRCPWMRSACSGTKSDSMRAPVFSSSVHVSAAGEATWQAVCTFTWPQERNRGRYCDKRCHSQDEEGEELTLRRVRSAPSDSMRGGAPVHRSCSRCQTSWAAVLKT